MGEMSDMVEMFAEQFLWERDKRYDTIKHHLEHKKWQTESGDLIKIKYMSDSHLRNTIKMILRNLEFEVYDETLGDICMDYVILMKKQLRKRQEKRKFVGWRLS